MLHLDVSVGDLLDIGNGLINIRVSKKKGQRVKIGIDAPEDLPVQLKNKTADVRQTGLPKRENFSSRKK